MRRFSPVLMATALLLVACHDKRPAEGPMEYTGRKVDQGAHEAKEGVKAGAHETKCAAKNAKDDVKKQPHDPECR